MNYCHYFFQLLLHKGIATFVINQSPKEDPKKIWSLVDEISGKLLADDEWHQVGITFDSGYGYIYIDICLY